MRLFALVMLATALVVAAPGSIVVHEADAMGCIVNCYVCVTNNPPCGTGDPGERLDEIVADAEDAVAGLPLP